MGLTMALIIGLAILIALYRFGKQLFIISNYFGLLVFPSVFFIGILAVELHEQKNWRTHYSQLSNFTPDRNQDFQLKVREVLKSSLYQDKYLVKVLRINDKKVSGQVLLNVEKDSLTPNLKVDDLLHLRGKMVDIKGPLNPHQFDYRHYLENQYV